MDARLRNLTYAAPLHIDVDVKTEVFNNSTRRWEPYVDEADIADVEDENAEMRGVKRTRSIDFCSCFVRTPL